MKHSQSQSPDSLNKTRKEFFYNMNNKKLVELCIIAMIAAFYAALTLALAPLSFGEIQIRISEALTLLPLLFPNAIWGVTLGCFIANLAGVMFGLNGIGILDVFFGTAATLIAAVLTYKLRNVRIKNIPVLSALMPVLFNGVIIGFELAWLIMPETLFTGWMIMGIQVGIGEFLACFVLGIPLILHLEKSESFAKIIN